MNSFRVGDRVHHSLCNIDGTVAEAGYADLIVNWDGKDWGPTRAFAGDCSKIERKFGVGDRVRVVKDLEDENHHLVGCVGNVGDVGRSQYPYEVDFDDADANYYCDEELEHVAPEADVKAIAARIRADLDLLEGLAA